MQRGVVYELRALTNRWLDPMAGTVISSHNSAKEAIEAFNRQPRSASDGSGQSSHGNYVAKTVIRVDPDGTETVQLPPPHGEGLQTWPYTG